MTNHIFQETRGGNVAHTTASKMLADDPLMCDMLGMVSEELHMACSDTGLISTVIQQ